MKYLLMVVLIFSFNSTMAVSGKTYETGSSLLKYCEAYINNTDAAEGNVCSGYVKGVSDAQSSFVGWGIMEPRWCSPEGVTQVQLMHILIKHLKEHPEQLHQHAGGLTVNAFIEAFSCE